MRKWIILFITFCTPFSLNATVLSIKTITDLIPIFESLDKNALVVFDIDDTLIMYKDAILEERTLPLRQKIIYTLLKKHPEANFNALKKIVCLQAEQALVEKETPQVITLLVERNILIIALTAADNLFFGNTMEYARFRRHEIERQGIFFPSTFQKHNGMEFIEAKKPNEPFIPYFGENILFSGKNSKGKVLVAFLKKAGLTPSQIIFIDDQKDRIQEVATSLQQAEIPATLVHYQHIENGLEPSEELSEFQFSYLLKNKLWLSTEKAQELYKATLQGI